MREAVVDSEAAQALVLVVGHLGLLVAWCGGVVAGGLVVSR